MTFRSKMFSGYGVVLLLMVTVSSIVYINIGSLIETSKWVEHTHKVIVNSKRLEKLLVDMETGERGFLIAGKDEFLEPYKTTLVEYRGFI